MTITTIKPLTPFQRLLTTPDEDAFKHCTVWGCTRPSQAYAGRGLNKFQCRYHTQRRNRHGDCIKGTYRASELSPYRKAAESYIKAHREDFWIASALTALQSLMDGAGPHERVVDTLTMTPQRKARAAFARMRVNEVSPLRLLTIHLAVTMAVKEDPIRASGVYDDYRLVQIAKAALRTASGYHSFYGISPQGKRLQYDRYPRSSGRYLRIMGKMINEACEHVAGEHLDSIMGLKVQRYGARERTVRVGKV